MGFGYGSGVWGLTPLSLGPEVFWRLLAGGFGGRQGFVSRLHTQTMTYSSLCKVEGWGVSG